MIDTKQKKKALAFVIFIVLLNLVVFGVLALTGRLESRSGTRIGYVGTATNSEWAGKYVLVNGKMSKSFSPKNGEILVEVVTESGSISMEITDVDGNKVYSGKDIETCSFSVMTDKDVNIKLSFDNHKGSFSFK